MRNLRSLAGAIILSVVAAANGLAADTGKLLFGQVMPGGTLSSAQVAIAVQKGLFQQAGVNVEITRFPSGRRALEAIIGGQIDLAFMAEYPPVIGALQKQSFAVITQLTKFSGNRIIGRSDLGFSTVESLAGKKIGTSIGTNAEFFTQLTLQKAGVQAEIVNLGPGEIVAALDRGDIEVAVPFPDYYDKAREILGSRYHEIISKDYDAYFVVSASRKIIEGQPGDIRKFLSALIVADDIIHKDPAAAKAAIIADAEGALTPKAVDEAWPEYDYHIGIDKAFLDLLDAEAKWVQAKGLIPGAAIEGAGLRAYVDDEPIKSLAPGLSQLSN